MDRIRFGRALGYGARHAAKSLLAAAEAASAPGSGSGAAPGAAAANAERGDAQRKQNGTPEKRATNPAESMGSTDRTAAGSRGAARTAAPMGQILRGAAQLRTVRREAGKQARRSFFSPLAKFSSVVSLQVTGTFFALLALIMAQAAWRSRAALHRASGAPELSRFYIVAAVGLLFAYFAVSNFVRARQRDRR